LQNKITELVPKYYKNPEKDITYISDGSAFAAGAGLFFGGVAGSANFSGTAGVRRIV
jgi:hypothetical protein